MLFPAQSSTDKRNRNQEKRPQKIYNKPRLKQTTKPNTNNKSNHLSETKFNYNTK